MQVYASQLGRRVLGCAIEVHSSLGPGLLESAYERCLAREFQIQDVRFRRQVPLPLVYKGEHLECGYRVDFVVEDEIVLEIKTSDKIMPIHDAQILTYLRLLKLRQAFLLNFNSKRLVDGIRSFLL